MTAARLHCTELDFVKNADENDSLMNSFYHLDLRLQWFVAWLMVSLLAAVFFGWLYILTKTIFAILFIFLLFPLQLFLLTPIMRLTGSYKYLSPMLLVAAPTEEIYDLHNGTTFDYLWVMLFRYRPGAEWRNRLLAYYLEGLLAVVAEIESGELRDSVIVRGSSYFFSEQTANRFGFKISHQTNSGEQINLLLNYLELAWPYSMACGRLALPDLRRIKTAEIEGAKLVQQKLRLQVLLQRLQFSQ